MDRVIIDETPAHKLLGLTFPKSCSWDDQIVNISEKASIRVNLLKALKFGVPRKLFDKCIFFRPSLNTMTLCGITAH